MTAIKVLRDLLPSAYRRDCRRNKRRKTQSLHNTGMDVDDSEHQHELRNANGTQSTAPSLSISRSLASHGLPDRLDPLSLDYLMDFDYHDGSCNCDFPSQILLAVRNGYVDQVIQYYTSRNRLTVEHNSQGETLLHLACRWGSVAVIKLMLCDFKTSLFVLDKHGRTPLHSLCMGINSSSLVESTTSRTYNHLDSLRLLLREKATLILFKDKYGKVPLDYLQQANVTMNNNVLLWSAVNEVLSSERVVEQIVEDMSHQIEMSRCGRRMTAWERIERMMDLSGLDAAIMETGLSV
mmetsp:Transcript_10676/g.25701  ORF Transcript_10676/g.25701 Transcript_10676/m.25701 type:complete len:294 (+) Transcript_10676:160-1041(+)